jgi:hypothetical protein
METKINDIQLSPDAISILPMSIASLIKLSPNNVKTIAAKWLIALNSNNYIMDIDQAIEGYMPDSSFWDACISYGPEPNIDDHIISVKVLLLFVLPYVDKISDNYADKLYSRITTDNMGFKMFSKIILKMSQIGAAGKFIKYCLLRTMSDIMPQTTSVTDMIKIPE